MTIKSELKKLELKNIIWLTIAGLINAFGITMFLTPVKLYDSGISGTSMLIAQITPSYISLPLLLIVLNAPLFLFGLRKQGITFTIYASYTVLIYSLGAWLITDILPIDVSMVSPLAGSDLLLCAVFGGLISGLGSGLSIRYGGAMDGIEVLSVILAKPLGLSVGTFVMIYNVILYIFCGIVLKSWILPLYSIVTYYAAIQTIDFIVDGIDRSKSAMIITAYPDKICKALSDTFGCGLTLIDAKGYFSDSEKTVIYFVVNRFQVGRMKNIVKRLDSNAYITISEVADVLSNNQD
ncbi:YitT family protein [Clostridium sp. MSJ-8]|uniref:YitT family protein n=1 Tax=Clostridium sp. MSJ-8 TaxID=2841510 RepID=UPI001C0EF9AD|nr:YitT family protein [Clostridium sp. MSJ-8]MBU5487279.1 YitT family protein [Clostridium sp. MSJ-8]